jgi:ankyrin repeat protein
MNKSFWHFAVLMSAVIVFNVQAADSIQVAASENDTNVMANCLTNGMEINSAESSYGCSALHLAASYNRKEAAKQLIERGANINVRDLNGMTPLHYAALHGHDDMIELLLNNKANVNAFDCQGLTPLHLAAQFGHAKTINLLIDRGADLNAKTNLQGLTPLHWAAFWGDTEAITALLKCGADINARDHNGQTPYMWADQNLRYEATRLLVRLGCEHHPHDRVQVDIIRPGEF